MRIFRFLNPELPVSVRYPAVCVRAQLLLDELREACHVLDRGTAMESFPS